MTPVQESPQLSSAPPRGSYVQFPTNYHLRSDLRRVHRKWPHTTLWLFSVCCAAKESRSGGALCVGGSPVTPADIDIVPCWERIEEGWVHDMVAAGLFTLDSDGAVVVSCRSQFISYWSDTAEARADRKASSRTEARRADLVTNGHESERVVTNRGESVRVGHELSRIGANPSESVTTGHELGRAGHESERIVTNQGELSRIGANLSEPVTTCHESKRNETNCHESGRILASDADEENRIEEKRIEKKRSEITPSIHQARESAEGAMEGGIRTPFPSEIPADSGQQPLDHSRIREAAMTGLNFLAKKPKFERTAELVAIWSRRYQEYTTEEQCEALVYAGQATAWAQRHGPEPIQFPAQHWLRCAERALPKIRDRNCDREASLRQGFADPGQLQWVPPDQEAL